MEPGHVIYETSPLSATRRWKLPKGRTWKNSHTFPDFYFEQFSFFFLPRHRGQFESKVTAFCAPPFTSGPHQRGEPLFVIEADLFADLAPRNQSSIFALHSLAIYCNFFYLILPANNIIMFHSVHLLWVQVLLKKVAIYCVRWNSMWRLHA